MRKSLALLTGAFIAMASSAKSLAGSFEEVNGNLKGLDYMKGTGSRSRNKPKNFKSKIKAKARKRNLTGRKARKINFNK